VRLPHPACHSSQTGSASGLRASLWHVTCDCTRVALLARPFWVHFRPLIAVLGIVAGLAACHEAGDVVVKDLSFSGVKAFPTSALTGVLATRESGWLPWSARHYFDRAEFEADLLRIHAYYADRGYPKQRVTGVHIDLAADRKSVRLRIDIDEGQPVRIQEVRYEGFEDLPASVRKQVADLPLRAGEPRDRTQVRSVKDMAGRLFRDNGYPLSRVDIGERPDGDPNQVILTVRADSGPAMRFGEVSMDGLKAVDTTTVRRQLAFEPGDLFQERLLQASQRRLASLGPFDFANVAPRLEERRGDSVPVHITVAEGPPRLLRVGAGYGTDEGPRGSLLWQHANFMGGARKADVQARASVVDLGVITSLTEPFFLGPAWSLTFGGRAERLQQFAYSSENYGGRVTLARRGERFGRLDESSVHYVTRLSYIHEYLRYGIRPEALDDLSSHDERIALGLDPVTGRAAGTLGSIDLDLERIAVNDPVQPTRGTALTLHLEHAAPWLLGKYRFDEVLVEGRGFVPVGRLVWANRASFGSVIARDPLTVPFSRRYFLGGATSLRGWGRYQVGPLDEQGLAIGGRTRVAMSTELRFPLRDKLSALVFVDAGQVGSADLSVERMRMRVDFGPGLRYRTPIGAVSVDLGIQLNPIQGLRINGDPEQRHWRLHLGIGQTF